MGLLLEVHRSKTHLSLEQETDVVLGYGAAVERRTLLYHLHHHQVQSTGQHPQGSAKVARVGQLHLRVTTMM